MYNDYVDLYTLWKNLEIDRETYDWMLSSHTTAGGSLATTEAVCEWLSTERGHDLACQWLQNTLAYQEETIDSPASLAEWKRDSTTSFIFYMVVG